MATWPGDRSAQEPRITAATSRAAIAAHRFGLAEPSFDSIAGGAQNWLQAQIGPADPLYGGELANSTQALKVRVEFRRRFVAARAPVQMATSSESTVDPRTVEQQFVDHFRTLVETDS